MLFRAVPCELNGEPIQACQLNPCPTIMFDSAEYRFNGNSGCNQMFGEYTCDQYMMNFSNVGSTRMMCDPEANEVESKMLNVMNNTDSFSVNDNKVTFYSKKQPIGVFIVKTPKACNATIDENGNKVHCGKHEHPEGVEEKHDHSNCKGHDHADKAACANKPAVPAETTESVEEKPAEKAQIQSVAAPQGADLKVNSDKSTGSKVETSSAAANSTSVAKEPEKLNIATPAEKTTTTPQQKAEHKAINRQVK